MRRHKHLLEQLLALARHEAGPNDEATVVPLDRTAKDLVADLVPDAARQGIDLGFQLIEPIATEGGPVMVATMIRNLLDNAVRFTQQGGRVDVGVYREGNEAVVQIEDTGPGIPSGDIDRILEPRYGGCRETDDAARWGVLIVNRCVV